MRNGSPVRPQCGQTKPSPSTWKLPVYNTVHHILTNPIYAGGPAPTAARRLGAGSLAVANSRFNRRNRFSKSS